MPPSFPAGSDADSSAGGATARRSSAKPLRRSPAPNDTRPPPRGSDHSGGAPAAAPPAPRPTDPPPPRLERLDDLGGDARRRRARPAVSGSLDAALRPHGDRLAAGEHEREPAGGPGALGLREPDAGDPADIGVRVRERDRHGVAGAVAQRGRLLGLGGGAHRRPPRG